MISVVLGFHLCVSRRSLQLTLALVCLCWLGCFLLFSVGELIFDLFLTSSNNLTATVESNAATETKKNVQELLQPFQLNGTHFYNLTALSYLQLGQSRVEKKAPE